MDLDVLFVGTAGAAPSARRGLPATVVRRGGERLLFDCGEGTQRQLMRSIGLLDFEEVFLTHYHADHVLGLPGMLKSFALRRRERPMTIYGPPGLGSFWRLLDPIVGRLPRGETVNGVRPDQVMGEPRRGRKLVLAGDTVPCEMTRLVAYEADLLVHEATLLEDEAERARETRHSTALGAAELAAAAQVTMLALTHVSPRYGGRELREEARAAFENTVVPRDFDRVELPFPERGEPVHVRASDRPPEREESAAPDLVP